MRDSRATHQIGWGSGGAEGRVGEGPPGPALCFALSFFIPQSVPRTSHSHSAPLCFYRAPASEGLIVRITINLRSDPTSLGESAGLLLDRSAVVFKSNSIRPGAAGQQEGRCLGASCGPDSKPDECIFLLGFNRAPPRKMLCLN